MLGNDVEWLPGDSGDNGEVANATVDRLLAEDVDAFIGAASSGVSLTVIDKITQAGKIHFSPANTSPTFTDYDDNGLYFRTAPSDVVQGAALADVMIADGAATAAFLVLNDSYGTGLLEFTKGPYVAGGGKWSSEIEIYDPQAENFDAEIAAVVEANPDAIVIIGFDETSKILTWPDRGRLRPGRPSWSTAPTATWATPSPRQFDDPSVVAGMKGTLPGVDVAGELADFRDTLLGRRSGADRLLVLGRVVRRRRRRPPSRRSPPGATTVCRRRERSTTSPAAARSAPRSPTAMRCSPTAPTSTTTVSRVRSSSSTQGEPSQASILILEFDETGTIVVAGSVQGSI